MAARWRCEGATRYILFFIFLLVCLRRLSTSLPSLCVILVFTVCVRVLLLYVSKITHTYFYFFLLGLDNVYFCLLMVVRWSACLSRHLVVCPFFSSMWRVQCSDLLRRVQWPSSWWRVQYFFADHAVGDFRLSFFVRFRDGRTYLIVTTTA